MFRNQYNNDATVWTPQVRIHQIEYAMEAAAKQVLVALKRAQSELAAHQKNILHLDNHIGISTAGFTADARLLRNFMSQECLDSTFVFDRRLPVSRLVALIGTSDQKIRIFADLRPVVRRHGLAALLVPAKGRELWKQDLLW
uniref:Proteasome alpha-type subunits domain-containing protein n=1 Tax=Rhinolophus ferrumequinum TaxID=59479 RepID=A0A671EJZ0_RHIFE